MVPPLMIISELLEVRKPSYAEETGVQIRDKGDFDCKCIWFSQNSFSFEESWISSKNLKVIQRQDHTLEYPSYRIGETIEFKTTMIEAGKKKSSLKSVSSSSESKELTITSEPSFSSPLMTVVGIHKTEIKEPLFDKLTNDQIRFYSKRQIKCKYYTPKTNKFSDILLPIESLNKIELVNEDIINRLLSAIDSNYYLCFADNSASQTAKHIIKPSGLTNLLGRYYINSYCYLTNRSERISITNETVFIAKKTVFLSEAPEYSYADGKFSSISNADYLRNLIAENGENIHLRIKYRGRFSSTTERTITKLKIIEPDDPAKETIEFLKADCLFRNDVRHFRISRILKMQLIDTSFELTPPASKT